MKQFLKLCLIAIKQLTKDLIRTPLTILYCKLKFRNKQTTYIFSHQAIGDAICTLGFLKEYREANNVNHITVVHKSSLTDIFNLYSTSWDQSIIISEKWNKRIVGSENTVLGYSYFKMQKNMLFTVIGNVARERIYHFSNYPEIDYKDVFRNEIFKLPKETKLNHPQIPKLEIEEYIKKHNLVKGKTVILNPYANTIDNPDILLFEELASSLLRQGYQVVTNISNNSQQPVKGTESIVCGLFEMVNLAEYCGYIIGIRSGFFDLMQFAKCKLIVLYPKDDDRMNFFKLKDRTSKIDIYEYQLKNKIDEDLKSLLPCVD